MSDWTRLVELYENLDREHELEKLDSLAIDALIPAGLKVPPWFRGIGRARQKLNKKISFHSGLMSSTPLAEMASDERVARLRFEQVDLDRIEVVDLPACGMGADALVLLDLLVKRKIRCRVRVSDIDELALNLCRYNLGCAFPDMKIEYKLEDYLMSETNQPLKEKGFAFLDPARRDEKGRHTGEYAPALTPSLEKLKDNDQAQIKLHASMPFPEDEAESWDLMWIETGGELKELCAKWPGNGERLVVRQDAACQVEMFCAHPGDENVKEVSIKDTQVLVVPRAGLLQSGLVQTWAQRNHCREIAELEGLFTSDGEAAPLSRRFELLAFGALKAKRFHQEMQEHVKDHPLELLAFKVKPDSESEKVYRKFLKNRGDVVERRTLLLCRGEKQRYFAILKEVGVGGAGSF